MPLPNTAQELQTFLPGFPGAARGGVGPAPPAGGRTAPPQAQPDRGCTAPAAPLRSAPAAPSPWRPPAADPEALCPPGAARRGTARPAAEDGRVAGGGGGAGTAGGERHPQRLQAEPRHVSGAGAGRAGGAEGLGAARRRGRAPGPRSGRGAPGGEVLAAPGASLCGSRAGPTGAGAAADPQGPQHRGRRAGVSTACLSEPRANPGLGAGQCNVRPRWGKAGPASVWQLPSCAVCA